MLGYLSENQNDSEVIAYSVENYTRKILKKKLKQELKALILSGRMNRHHLKTNT